MKINGISLHLHTTSHHILVESSRKKKLWENFSRMSWHFKNGIDKWRLATRNGRDLRLTIKILKPSNKKTDKEAETKTKTKTEVLNANCELNENGKCKNSNNFYSALSFVMSWVNKKGKTVAIFWCRCLGQPATGILMLLLIRWNRIFYTKSWLLCRVVVTWEKSKCK